MTSEKPVGLQLDAFLGKDIEIAVRGNGLDIDFVQPGFPGGFSEDFKRSGDIAGQHPVIDDHGDINGVVAGLRGRGGEDQCHHRHTTKAGASPSHAAAPMAMGSNPFSPHQAR